MGMDERVKDPREQRRAIQFLISPRLQALLNLANVLYPRTLTPGFPDSQIRRPRRQTAASANGWTQSVNFVFARHSQPMSARSSGVPPTVSGAPFWQHTDERHLSPSCVWHRSFFLTSIPPIPVFASTEQSS